MNCYCIDICQILINENTVITIEFLRWQNPISSSFDIKTPTADIGHPESKLYRSCQNFVRQIWRALMQFSKAFDEES